jgi:ComF family protein
MFLKKLLLDCLFAPVCLGCGQAGASLCANCFKILEVYHRHQPSLANIDELIIAGDYQQDLVAVLIRAYKYQFQTELAIPLAAFLSRALETEILKQHFSGHVNELGTAINLIPLPLSKKRQRWRGFNQSELLARELSKLYGWPLNLDLKRRHNTKPQASLSEAERLNNQSGNFIWTGAKLNGQTILLLDDVITTGATMSAAGEALKKAGASKIIGLAIAKS